MKEKIIESMCAFLHRIIPCTFLLFFLFFICCNSDQNTSFDVEKSIKNTVKRFAYYKNLPSADLYKLDRTVIMEEQGIKLHLHVAHFLDRSHEIVTIVNSQNESYSIPMFSNEISNYWDFELQDKDSTLPTCHTTFEKEFHTAMGFLHLNDTIHTDLKVLHEIMRSLIVNCKPFTKLDKILLYTERDNWDYNSEHRAAQRKTFDAISQYVAPSNYSEWGVFWSHNSNRIYHIHLGEDNREKADIFIKVYIIKYSPEKIIEL